MQKVILLVLIGLVSLSVQAQVDGYVKDAPVPTEFSVSVPETIKGFFFLSFKMPDAQKLEWHIYDPQGKKIVKEKWGKKGPGVYLGSYNIKYEPAGTYTFKAMHGEAVYETTFEKVDP